MQIADLRICGGPSKFKGRTISVGTPHLGSRHTVDEYLNDIYSSNCLSNHGPLVKLLETRIEQIVGAYCIATCNATVGLQVVAKALNLTGKIIIPTFTFPATANAMAWVGLDPIFCDVDQDHLLNPNTIAITPDTSAILGVHLWGKPCHVEALTKIARQSKLALIFDAAHAFGCSNDHTPIGNFGNAEVFSLHATKTINCGEGGIISTKDKYLAAKIRKLINHGNGTLIGTNGKLSEIAAAFGLACLDDRAMIVEANRSRYLAYENRLPIVEYDEATNPNYQYIVLSSPHRNLIATILTTEGVNTKKYFWPNCHKLACYKHNDRSNNLTMAETIAGKTLILPTGDNLSLKDVEIICDIIDVVLDNHHKLENLITEHSVGTA